MIGYKATRAKRMVHWIFEKQPRPRSVELRVRDELDQKYTVYISGGDWWEDKEEMIAWCSKYFGIRNEKYNNPRWSHGAVEFRFKNKKDATLFILRWSE